MAEAVVKLVYERGSASARAVEQILASVLDEQRQGELPEARALTTVDLTDVAVDLTGSAPSSSLTALDVADVSIDVAETHAGFDAHSDIVIELTTQVVSGVTSGVMTAALVELWHRFLHPTLERRLAARQKRLGPARNHGIEVGSRHRTPADEDGQN